MRWYLTFEGAWLLRRDADDTLLGYAWRNGSGWHPCGRTGRVAGGQPIWGWLTAPVRDHKKAKALVWAHAEARA